MIVPGWCERCRRFRVVRVSVLGQGIAVGVCQECEVVR